MKFSLTKPDIAVSTADVADNVDIVDVVGNKSDTIAGTSLVALTKVVDTVVDTISANTFLMLEKTVNLAQVAAAYDLFTATGDIYVEDINLYCTVVGATFTSVAIATNDAVPTVIMTAAEGAVANIVAGTNFQQATKGKTFRLTSGNKIQYTIVGTTGTGTVVAEIKYRPISVGATLA